LFFKNFQKVLDEARDGVLCLDVNAYEIATGSADGNVRRFYFLSSFFICSSKSPEILSATCTC